MPELPEVETIRRDLERRVISKKINIVKVLNPTTVKSSLAVFIKLTKGQSFSGIERIGKLLIFKLNDRYHFLLVHLKMTGQLIYVSKNELIAGGHSLNSNNGDFKSLAKLPGKSTRIYFTFADKSQLFFNDQRKFGYLKIVNEKELDDIKKNYGLEPLTANFILTDFIKIFSGRQKNVKALLLDQKLISGIGNIYADEALFLSGIRPDRRAGSLSRIEIKKLFSTLNIILKKAILHRGTTFSDYVDADGKKGNFTQFLQVYGRGRADCFKCHRPLKKAKIAGRGTVYCSYCQK